MKDFIYEVLNLGKVYLYEIIDGQSQCVKTFKDREDMLVWLENKYEYCNLKILEKYIHFERWN